MDHAERFRKRHDEVVGACHRCGWSGPVTKVRRRDRRALGTRHAFGRLCADCVDELRRPRGARRDAPDVRRSLRAVHHRDVA
jgi:hypothetical protein